MESGRVVEGVHVIEGEELKLIGSGDELMWQALGFEGGPEALPWWGQDWQGDLRFHESVVVAVALATHALGDAA